MEFVSYDAEVVLPSALSDDEASAFVELSRQFEERYPVSESLSYPGR